MGEALAELKQGVQRKQLRKLNHDAWAGLPTCRGSYTESVSYYNNAIFKIPVVGWSTTRACITPVGHGQLGSDNRTIQYYIKSWP